MNKIKLTLRTRERFGCVIMPVTTFRLAGSNSNTKAVPGKLKRLFLKLETFNLRDFVCVGCFQF